MNTTFRSFVDALEALNVEDVARAYKQGPPKSLDTEDLPAMWVQMPRGAEQASVFGEFRGVFSSFQADLVVAVAAVGQAEEPFRNFDDTVDMMDNLAAGLGAVTACGVISKSKHHWRIRQTEVKVAGVAYWAVVARVEGNG